MAGWLESQRGGVTASGSLALPAQALELRAAATRGGLTLSLHVQPSEIGLRPALTRQNSHSAQNRFYWSLCVWSTLRRDAHTDVDNMKSETRQHSTVSVFITSVWRRHGVVLLNHHCCSIF